MICRFRLFYLSFIFLACLVSSALHARPTRSEQWYEASVERGDTLPKRDPFVPLFERRPRRGRFDSGKRGKKTQPIVKRVAPPLAIDIRAIVGLGGSRRAIIKYEGEEYWVTPGWRHKPKTFAVTSVKADEVVVYNLKEGRVERVLY